MMIILKTFVFILAYYKEFNDSRSYIIENENSKRFCDILA